MTSARVRLSWPRQEAHHAQRITDSRRDRPCPRPHHRLGPRLRLAPPAPAGEWERFLVEKSGNHECGDPGESDPLIVCWYELERGPAPKWTRHDISVGEMIGDAVFHAEFRYTKVEGRTGYNSVVYVQNNQDGSLWHQAQIGDRTRVYLFGETPGADGKKRFFTTLNEVTDGRVKPAGEWNTLEITARGKVLTLWVNGAVTCEIRDCGNPKGLVGVEGEGFRIEFRNLKVKPLR